MNYQKIFVVFSLFFLLSACSESAVSTSISIGQLQSRIAANNPPVILDVRSSKEFNKGHIPGAIHIPVKQLADKLSQLADNQLDEVVVYCFSGPRANTAEEILRAAGFSRVIELEGHFEAWKDAELPISTK